MIENALSVTIFCFRKLFGKERENFIKYINKFKRFKKTNYYMQDSRAEHLIFCSIFEGRVS